jgi:integrase
VRLLLLTGARRGELLAAKWTDIDLALPDLAGRKNRIGTRFRYGCGWHCEREQGGDDGEPFRHGLATFVTRQTAGIGNWQQEWIDRR